MSELSATRGRMARLGLLALLVIGFPGAGRTGASAQPVDDGAAPAGRAHHRLVYDAANRRVLMIGGSAAPAEDKTLIFENLWAFDGASWTRLGATGAARSDMAVAYDAARGRVLALGGFNPMLAGRYADFQVLKGHRWEPIGEIPDRPQVDALVHDVKRDRIIAYGVIAGTPPQTASADTWEYDGATWTRTGRTGPGVRRGYAIVYDEKRARTVLIGGSTPGVQGPLDDTWEYDGTAWTRVATGGPARVAAAAAYDSSRGLVVLFGGRSREAFVQDTWAWDGSAWRLLSETGPARRGLSAMAYDRARDRIVLFGGRHKYPDGDLRDTWEWDGSQWKEIK